MSIHELLDVDEGTTGSGKQTEDSISMKVET